jgi:hypothetical protein
VPSSRRAVRYFYLNMRINNFVGAAWRAIQEGGFAVELSLLVGCGLKTHDVNPNGEESPLVIALMSERQGRSIASLLSRHS